MLKRLIVPAMLLPLAGCYDHPRHYHRDEEVVTYQVESAPPPPVVREEVVIERDRPYVGAVYVGGRWEQDRVHRRWVWRRGYWR